MSFQIPRLSRRTAAAPRTSRASTTDACLRTRGPAPWSSSNPTTPFSPATSLSSKEVRPLLPPPHVPAVQCLKLECQAILGADVPQNPTRLWGTVPRTHEFPLVLSRWGKLALCTRRIVSHWEKFWFTLYGSERDCVLCKKYVQTLQMKETIFAFASRRLVSRFVVLCLNPWDLKSSSSCQRNLGKDPTRHQVVIFEQNMSKP